VRVTNLNPADTIGASAWLVETGGHSILLDAGSHPGEEGRAALPLFDLAPDQVEAIAISHCHHDHCGSLPVALRHFPRARVLMTEPSYFLIERVLHNSVNVMKRQREERGILDYPLYHHRELDELAYLFQGFRFGRVEPWGELATPSPATPSPTISFHPAGHVLGAAGLRVAHGRESLFYSGDVCFHDQTLTPKADFENVRADVLILETTRGATETPANFSRDAEAQRLIEAIGKSLRRGAGVLVPVFALGRTQEVLAEIALAMQSGVLKRQPVFIGGLGRVFTEIYDHFAGRAPNRRPELILHEALDLQVMEWRQLETLKPDGRLFVITAGMMSEHTFSHELALRMAPVEKHAIHFVGYAAPDTPAGRLRATARGEEFPFSESAATLTRNCELQAFDLSAHANRGELVDFALRLNPRTVILGHGEPDARAWVEAELRARAPHLVLHQPAPGETVEV
jgi:Cft2 family RNA processing exonuclease